MSPLRGDTHKINIAAARNAPHGKKLHALRLLPIFALRPGRAKFCRAN